VRGDDDDDRPAEPGAPERQALSDRILQSAQALEGLRRAGLPDAGAVQRLMSDVAALHADIERLSRADAEMRARQEEIDREHARLERENQRMRRLARWSSIAWALTRPDGRVVELSDEAERVLGVAPEEAIDVPLVDYLLTSDGDRIAAAVRRLAPDSEEWIADVVTVRGGPAGCRIRVAPELDERGELVGHLWLFDAAIPGVEDVPELESISKTEFLARIAHELRNPLAPVRTAVDLWRQQGDQLTEEQRQWTIDVVGRQADHLAHLVDHLLDVAELSRREVRLRRSVVDLRDVVEQAHDVVRSNAQLHHVDVEMPDDPVRVEGDPARLRRVVVDLLEHALRSTPRGGTLCICVEGDDEHAVLLVRDEGVGTTADVLDEVFGGDGRSSPLEAPASAPQHRLALVRRLVELHGGTVAVHETEIGHGHEVIVCLPRVVAANSDAPPPRAEEERPLRVLIVDDNVDAAEMLALLLEARGLETTLAFDGQGALAAFEWARPDAVLLDLALPDMDGLDVARQLRARKPNVPLIALTGYGDEAMRSRTASLGFAHHLTKPVDVTAVCRVLDEVPRR
jgi:signal transduction histidine kinase/CheY-like chemotaxis protein